MGDEVSRIGKVTPATGNGTGSARSRGKAGSMKRGEERDSIMISDEARRRCESDIPGDGTFNESEELKD